MFILHSDPSEQAPNGPAVIVDTCVLVDIALSTRARHAQAAEFATCLLRKGIVIRVPMHAAFEFMCAVRQEVRQLGGSHSSWAAGSDENQKINIWPVPIDGHFLDRYRSANIPDVRSGDLPFLVMAMVDNVALVTEDDELFRKATQVGVRVFRIAEYLAQECSR